ncbi:MAG TPA: glutaredoxin family protein [candidate division Zixibacteria bacterium]|nr:glutaredoxin family protein [candidate division Zixibacteria bacterium]MDD4917033.1 glutaredoxin family protein [candidate division Zixibacteria bacterium]MDM7972870.1 glutaredoxin family protein [candidate division Zixibacteria bacterium]HOD66650.1 glutaredoxin family protein [candidate division Zixibacteria bacterium]HPI33465.1 glutaredoxin family protein [candidate division Zixibacteria bacterium]
MNNVVMYTKEGCPYCAAARKHYAEQGIRFTEIDIHRTPGARDKVLALTGGEAIVPVIVDNGQVIKGFGGG